MVIAAVVLSLIGILKILFVIALLVLLIVGIRYLFGLVGWSIPNPIWTVIGIVVLLALLIWFLGGGGVEFR